MSTRSSTVQPSPPPFRPASGVDRTPVAAPEPTVALRAALVVLAVVIILASTGIGLIAGLIWSFGACFKQTCSDVDAAAIVLLPLVGLAAGLAAAVGLRVKRAWFYRHPLVVWVPVGLAGAYLALALLSQI